MAVVCHGSRHVVAKSYRRLCTPPDDLGEGLVDWRSSVALSDPLPVVGAWYSRRHRPYTKTQVWLSRNGAEKSVANLVPAVVESRAQIPEPSSGGNDPQLDGTASSEWQ